MANTTAARDHDSRKEFAMLHIDDEAVRSQLLRGHFGLERETLRITPDGYMAQTPDPFVGNPNVVRDFSENQLEINTSVTDGPSEAVAEILRHDRMVQRHLASQPEPELLWPFSNPPYIRTEEDVPIAQYEGEDASKTAYRNYLADHYGRYKMTFCGIHFNYSFADELLRADFAHADTDDFEAYKAAFYLGLAQRAVACGFVMTAATAASPLCDGSYLEKRALGEDLYLGLATVRQSELGYWNFFTPVLDYSSPKAYAQSIKDYIDKGYITSPSELYYPIRVKPKGAYGLANLAAGKISHIELRMFDLNPLVLGLIDERDVHFGQLFLVWLACMPDHDFAPKDQILAVRNFKYAAHYDLRTCNVCTPSGKAYTVVDACLAVMDAMTRFYESLGDDLCTQEVRDTLAYQRNKFECYECRYPHQVRDRFGDGFVKKGLELAKAYQQAQLD
jgi:glutamate--cysteine ligase